MDASPVDTVGFRVLGPLEVVSGDRVLPLRGITQRAALGFLLLHANRTVATSDLVTALWPASAPATARKMLQNAVSGLRGTLARHGVNTSAAALVSRSPGYALRVDPRCLDLARFRRCAEQGRAQLSAGSFDGAAQLLRDALSLWRGSALEDLTESGIHWPELAGLHSAQMAVHEDLYEAELARGRHYEVVGNLQSAVDLDLLRERMCGLLMRALYRCGRQVEALHVYHRHRTALLDQLGLEPGRELLELERAILNHDPALALPPREAAPQPVVGTTLRSAAGPARRARQRTRERNPELAVLHGVLEWVRQRRRAHLVIVLGGPGTGKSQLVARLRNAVREDEGAVRCVVGRTRPGSAGAEATAAVLDEVTEVLRPAALGAGAPAAAAREESFAAWRSVLEQASSVRPLIAVFEDVHQADDTLADFIGDVVRSASSVPLLMVATARPEFLERQPGWGGGLACTTLTLDSPTSGRAWPIAQRSGQA